MQLVYGGDIICSAPAVVVVVVHNVVARRPPMPNTIPGIPSSTKDPFTRRRSLQLTHQQPVDVPIPPSLLQSPYLNSPIFQRTLSSRRQPSKEDEQWLQDTVPLAFDAEKKRGRDSVSSSQSRTFDASSAASSSALPSRAQSMSRAPPLSPPLTRWQQQNNLAPSPAWLPEPRVRSAPCSTEQEYFGSTAR
ncbi:hypothetical protein Hypma_008804 [Hypsizygus marmoreus]|uniref:Uncharacterized protein n=1 Tax=Hypsizygus marmoreus TaxID=39966 RepID=A0A369JUU6_HYPMA|nr:hypothetical protein Hypma_008804 [Hypsizygus marmoreus]